MYESDINLPEQRRPKLVPPTAVPDAFDEGRIRATNRTDAQTASRLAAWSIALGLIGVVTCGASAAVGVVLGISSLMKRRTRFGWIATSVSVLCTLAPIGGFVWFMVYSMNQLQRAMLNSTQPTMQASSDLAQWHGAFVTAKVTDDAPAVWSIELIRQRNPNTVLASTDPWNRPYQLETSGPYEFRSLGFDGIEGTADDIVIDAEGIVRTIDAGNGAEIGSNAPIVMPPMLTITTAYTLPVTINYPAPIVMPPMLTITVPPATQAELALLNEAETAARFQLILDCMKLGGGTPELREELSFLARQQARLQRLQLQAEMESAREPKP